MEQQTIAAGTVEAVKAEAETVDAQAVAAQTAAVNENADAALMQLFEQVPELQGEKQVPKEVFEISKNENISLFDAYLRHQYREQQAVAAEQQRRQRTAEMSAGSLHTGGLRAAPMSDAFARAFEQALS